MFSNPITPPPELVERLCNNVSAFSTAMPPLTTKEVAVWLIEEAYVAGANQELEACCEWLKNFPHFIGIEEQLRTARRPKPPSLKEQALIALHAIATGANDTREQHQDLDTIRKALEALPND
jgi:hypothetical protein